MKAALTTLLAFLLLCASTQAATVTTLSDGGPGSLRSAIANATPGETIGFSVNGIITLTSGELLVNQDLSISGPGADKLTVKRSTAVGTPGFRIFHLTSGEISLSGMALANGKTNSGSGILNETSLTLQNCIITGNSATDVGGGVDNQGTLTIINCSIRSNSVTGYVGRSASGGGINNEATLFNDAVLFLTNSIVADNSVNGGAGAGCGGGGIRNTATFLRHAIMILDTSTIDGNLAVGGSGNNGGSAKGGGIANDSYNSMATVVRSTISHNSAIGGSSGTGFGGTGDGGGVANFSGTMLIENSTISGNSAVAGIGPSGTHFPAGAGIISIFANIFINHSTVTANLGNGIDTASTNILKNSIVAGNFGRVDLENDIPSNTQSAGFNLIGSVVGDITLLPTDRTDITADDLRLGPLQNNGGPTFTHALLCGSAAINGGDNTNAPPTDQRGFPRIVDGIIDIGAFELSNVPPTITCSAPQTFLCASPAGELATLSINVADADGDMLVVIWTVNGVPVQTNLITAGISMATQQLSFTALFDPGTNAVTVSVTDPSDCVATCATGLTVLTTGAPSIICPVPMTVSCAPPTGTFATILVAVADEYGQPTVVVWTLNGSPVQTNLVPGGGPAQLSFTTTLAIATNELTITASNSLGCVTTCSTSISVVGLGDVYPIALNIRSLVGVPIGGVLKGIESGAEPGNFGWLTWAGSPNESTLVTSLTSPGDSRTYLNPGNPSDHMISVGGWIQAKPGISISDQVRLALEKLKQIDITLPVWDRSTGHGSTGYYHIVGFARVRLLDYQLPHQNQITVRLLGFSDCR